MNNIAGFPKDVQKLLEAVRATIKKATPQAEEAIKYGIPTFVLNGNLVHFGGFKHHIGFSPIPGALEEFREELSTYEGAKGSMQFPFDRLLPLNLITKIVKYRIDKNLEMTKAKAKKNSTVYNYLSFEKVFLQQRFDDYRLFRRLKNAKELFITDSALDSYMGLLFK
jgi:uncharacterized protein YdhG (YjbR/CyaY superfamily)